MHANSSVVVSNQAGLHEQLQTTVLKHLNTEFRRPIAAHAIAAWQQLQSHWPSEQPLILDSGCGTARSTQRLAELNPDCFVVGVDRSAQRLDKQAPLPANAMLLRTNLEDFWRLLAQHQVTLFEHSLLYPNPCPKAAQLRYRWHGSPAFGSLLQLAGKLTLRSNWRLYLDEFSSACRYAGVSAEAVISTLPLQAQPMTAFEEKYQQSGQALYELKIQLP